MCHRIDDRVVLREDCTKAAFSFPVLLDYDRQISQFRDTPQRRYAG